MERFIISIIIFMPLLFTYLYFTNILLLTKYILTKRLYTKLLCWHLNIKNYKINKDGSIDVDGDVHLTCLNLKYIPLEFRSVNGIFNISNNKNLKSLKGSPTECFSFLCIYSNVESLKYITSNYKIIVIRSSKLKSTKYLVINDECHSVTIETKYRSINRFLNTEHIKSVIKNQENYKIWNKDESININRFNLLLSDIKSNQV